MSANARRGGRVPGPDQLARRLVARAGDGLLDRTAGTRPGMRLLFAGMRRMYRPDRTGGFRGEIEFAFETRRGVERWTLDCGDREAVFRAGAATAPTLKVRVTLVDFLRVGTGGLDAGAAMARGRLGFQGDFRVATMLGAMFGGKPFL
ncbi:MAG: SCP2 sterol-binding domain-containing protein [Actinobacteria bacterium]|nr:SCP2 sterol-binding domain-containing protein [Actinomycetota bacterium]